MTILLRHTVQIDNIIICWTKWNFDLMMVLDEKSRDYTSYWEEDGCLHQISWQSSQWLMNHSRKNQVITMHHLGNNQSLCQSIQVRYFSGKIWHHRKSGDQWDSSSEDCAEFHGNPFNSCWYISVCTKVMDRPTAIQWAIPPAGLIIKSERNLSPYP